MFKKPTKNSIKTTAVEVLSATGGGMLSEGVMNIMPKKQLANYEEVIRGGLALVAAGGMAAINGKSTQAKALRAALAGVTIVQLLQVAKKVALKMGISTPTAESTTVDKFVGGVFGLSCPCNEAPQNVPLVRMPQLNAPNLDFEGQRLENFGFSEDQPILENAFD